MDPALATVTMFAGNFAPRNWLLCQGQLLSIASNTALFSLLGTTYGGDGRTTFGLPDLRGRAPMHPGTGPGLPTIVLGEQSGTETVSLNTTNLPSHDHTGNFNFLLEVSSNSADSRDPIGKVLANGSYEAFATGRIPDATLGGVTGASGLTGGNNSIDIRQPYLAVNFIICLLGVYPSRNSIV